MLNRQEFSSYDGTVIGSLDGVNVNFMLTAAPSVLRVHKNGIRMESGLDYTGGGAAITFSAIQTPQPGDTITVEGYL